MKRLIQLILSAAILALAVSACHKTDSIDSRPVGNPGITDPEPEFPEFDFSPELTDRSTRYVSSSLNLHYDNGGILVACTDRSIRFVDLNDESQNVILSSGAPFKAGTITNLTVIENGKTVPVKLATVEQLAPTHIYLNILTAGGSRIVAAVTTPEAHL